jgi:hypothetical protein
VARFSFFTKKPFIPAILLDIGLKFPAESTLVGYPNKFLGVTSVAVTGFLGEGDG